MFASIGYTSLGEVIDKFELDYLFHIDRSEDDRRFNEIDHMKQIETKWRIGEHFSRQPSLSVCLPSGGVVRIAADFLKVSALMRNEFLDFHPCLSMNNYYISLDLINRQIEIHERWYRKIIWEKNDGYIGSDPNDHRRVVRLNHMHHLARRFQPLVGGSVQVATVHAPIAVSDLAPASIVAPVTDAEIIREILQMSAVGARRDDIRNAVCPGMPVEAWRTLWKEAAKIKPEISKSGPKPAQFGS
ncbi:hypothetical protein [Paracoccus aerius]|uniref:Uncharacterized protein n=1 Tax=Paracoccus aerius TaxID=1915382 RepID=A0ABS1S9D5_9RHOB|nr:hypothetical protein [Paracoccus aerius]MBL3674890.1 hypothetical protein [Paracoccus aerius]GHG29709.1 hypothetical protein GCM10017322_30460 [Paracoccus aerius]